MATFDFKQVATGTSVFTFDVTATLTPSPGNTLIAVLTINHELISYSISDGVNTWNQIRINQSTTIAYASNVAGGSTTVSISSVVADSDVNASSSLQVIEYEGALTLDVNAGATGISANADSGNTSPTTVPNELVFSTISYSANKYPGFWDGSIDGCTIRNIITGNVLSTYATSVGDRLISSIGAQNSSTTFSDADSWEASVVTFYGGGVATPTFPGYQSPFGWQ